MDAHDLVRMANQIGQFHESLPSHAEALLGTATHIRRFWDPRMRRELFAHLDESQGEGLHDLTLEALRTHRSMVEPSAVSSPQAP